MSVGEWTWTGNLINEVVAINGEGGKTEKSKFKSMGEGGLILETL